MDKTIIQHPVISEKSTMLSEMGKYIFAVREGATAPEVRKTIESLYKVKVVKLNMINTKDKPKTWGRLTGVKHGYRKAIVTLKEGQKLDVLPK